MLNMNSDIAKMFQAFLIIPCFIFDGAKVQTFYDITKYYWDFNTILTLPTELVYFTSEALSPMSLHSCSSLLIKSVRRAGNSLNPYYIKKEESGINVPTLLLGLIA